MIGGFAGTGFCSTVVAGAFPSACCLRMLPAMLACASCGAESPDGFRFCGACGSPLAAPAARAPRGAQGRVRAVLRPRRVHRDVRGRGPRGRRPDAQRVLRDGPRADRGPRRGRREVHRRRGARGVRGACRPRGRSRARGPGRPPDLRGRGELPEPRRAAPAPAGRDQHRRGPRPARRGPGLGRAVPRRRHDQHGVPDPVGRARDGRRGRSRDVRGDEARVRVRGAPARGPQGQGGARPGVPCEGVPRAPRRRPHPHPRGRLRRPRDRPRAAQGPVRQERRRELGPARHGRRRARHRQEPDRRRAPRPCPVPGARA